MNFLLLLGQTAESAEKAIGWVERLIQGGPALIFGFFCAVLGLVVYYQHKRHAMLEMDYRKTLEGQIATATTNTEKLITAMTKTETVLSTNEQALRSCHDTMTRMGARLDQVERQGS